MQLLSTALSTRNYQTQFVKANADGIEQGGRRKCIPIPLKVNEVKFLRALVPPLIATVLALSPLSGTPDQLGNREIVYSSA